MSTLLDNINPKFFDEVFDRVQTNALRNEQALVERIKYYKKLQKFKSDSITGGFENEIKNAQYWLDKHRKENVELLI